MTIAEGLRLMDAEERHKLYLWMHSVEMTTHRDVYHPKDAVEDMPVGGRISYHRWIPSFSLPPEFKLERSEFERLALDAVDEIKIISVSEDAIRVTVRGKMWDIVKDYTGKWGLFKEVLFQDEGSDSV